MIPDDPIERAIENRRAIEAIEGFVSLAIEIEDALGEHSVEWRFAGSLRRYCDLLATERFSVPKDIEIVAVPRIRYVQDPFDPSHRYPVNLLLERLDLLIAEGAPGWERHPEIVSASGRRRAAAWGEKHRRFLYKGVAVDLFLTTTSFFGHILLIRTGPAKFSKRYVTRLRQEGFVSSGGEVTRDGERYPLGDERVCFAAAEIGVISPGERERRFNRE